MWSSRCGEEVIKKIAGLEKLNCGSIIQLEITGGLGGVA